MQALVRWGPFSNDLMTPETPVISLKKSNSRLKNVFAEPLKLSIIVVLRISKKILIDQSFKYVNYVKIKTV